MSMVVSGAGRVEETRGAAEEIRNSKKSEKD
jgi:hypothetical protein